MGKIIIIASGKGGTGKTTATANIGSALAARGLAEDRKVVLVDMDMGLRNLDIALGLESDIVYDIADVIDGRCALDDAIVKDERYDNLYFVPAPQTRFVTSFAEDRVVRVWEQLRNRFDVCIADAPAGTDGGFTYAAMCADAAVIVTTPELSALRDADRAISALEDMGVKDIRLIINRVRPDMIDRGVMMNMDDCVDMLQIPILGIVPEDERLIAASFGGTLAVSTKDSRAGRAFRNIAARLDGEQTLIMDMEENKGFLKRIKKLFAG